MQEMSLDSIPIGLLLKLFDRLPFKDRVRLRGVNRLFNAVSKRSINKMRSLEINGDLEEYSVYSQPFPSLLESCSSSLESIKITNRSCSISLLSALAEFVYPKLERLEIIVTNNDLTKKLIGRNRNLRSVILYLNREFEWPKDIVFEKLEKLEIHSSKDSNDDAYVNISPILRPLISNIPNLERLKILGDPKSAPLILSVEDLNKLLASVPHLEILDLNLSPRLAAPQSGPFASMYWKLMIAMPRWHLPNLTYLGVDMKYEIPSSILQHFSNSCPQLNIVMVTRAEIDDQALVALSKLKKLGELTLLEVEMTEEKATKMIDLLPWITILFVKKIDPLPLQALPQLRHLLIFYLYGMEMTRSQIINIITNLPSLYVLGLWTISDARFPAALIGFVTSTASMIQRKMQIRIRSMRINGTESELNQMKAVLEEIEKNGGPMVLMDGADVRIIRYNH